MFLFGTKTDFEEVLKIVESELEEDLQYVLCYMAEHVSTIRYSTGTIIQDLGGVTVGRSSSEKQYLILPAQEDVYIEEIKRGRFDASLYALDASTNPKSIVFQPAGVFENRSVIEGRLSTGSTDAETIRRYGKFAKVFRNHFKYVSYAWVGPEALHLFDQGVPLCQAANVPPSYWLKRSA